MHSCSNLPARPLFSGDNDTWTSLVIVFLWKLGLIKWRSLSDVRRFVIELVEVLWHDWNSRRFVLDFPLAQLLFAAPTFTKSSNGSMELNPNIEFWHYHYAANSPNFCVDQFLDFLAFARADIRSCRDEGLSRGDFFNRIKFILNGIGAFVFPPSCHKLEELDGKTLPAKVRICDLGNFLELGACFVRSGSLNIEIVSTTHCTIDVRWGYSDLTAPPATLPRPFLRFSEAEGTVSMIVDMALHRNEWFHAAADSPSVENSYGVCTPMHPLSVRGFLKDAGVILLNPKELQTNLQNQVQTALLQHQRRNQPGSTIIPNPLNQVQIRQPNQQQPANSRTFSNVAADPPRNGQPIQPIVLPERKKDNSKFSKVQPSQVRSQQQRSIQLPNSGNSASSEHPKRKQAFPSSRPKPAFSAIQSQPAPPIPPLLDFSDFSDSDEKEEPLCPPDLE